VTEPWAATEAQAGAFQPALPRAGLPQLQVHLLPVVAPPKRRQKDRTRLLRQTSAPAFALTPRGWAPRHGAPRPPSGLVSGQGAVLELVSPLERYRTREMAFYLFALLI
jgi:hypothetical protein